MASGAVVFSRSSTRVCLPFTLVTPSLSSCCCSSRKLHKGHMSREPPKGQSATLIPYLKAAFRLTGCSKTKHNNERILSE